MERAKRIAVIGSTGNIGKQTLEVAKQRDIEVVAISCHSNTDLMLQQARELPSLKYLVIGDNSAYNLMRGSQRGVKVMYGDDGIAEVCSDKSIDTVLNANIGIAGLNTTLFAIKRGKRLALANKESLVTGGQMVMELLKNGSAPMIPVDSEHSAIFQCIGAERKNLDKIMLTLSGGPFLKMPDEQKLRKVTVEQASTHPRWKMGAIITINSATWFNKQQEIIEAAWLFALKPAQIEILVHPQSIVHSGVKFVDRNMILQASDPNMRLPIQYALTYPTREVSLSEEPDLARIGMLEFSKPGTHPLSRSLRLGFTALEEGGTSGAVLNGANEKAVEMFRARRIGFMDIVGFAEKVLEEHIPWKADMEGITAADKWARTRVEELARA